MMEVNDGRLVVTRHGRRIAIQASTDATFYAALLIFGVRPVVAKAAALGLITIVVKVSTP